MMCLKQVKTLRQLLKKFNPAELVHLADEKEKWLPRLRAIDMNEVVTAICTAVKGSEVESETLRQIAWIRCRLILIRPERTWRFYRLNEAPRLEYCTALVERIASEMGRLLHGSNVAPHASFVHEAVLYACLMAEERGADTRVKHYALHVAMWTTPPLMATNCVSTMERHAEALLYSALGSDTLEFVQSFRVSLETAFRCANSILSKGAARAQGEQCPGDDDQPQAPLAVGFQTQELSTGRSESGTAHEEAQQLMNTCTENMLINLDAVNSAIKAVKALRCNVTDVFSTLEKGVPCAEGEENKGKAFMDEFQGILGSVISCIRELETAVTILGSPFAELKLGSTSHLSQDRTLDRQALYTDELNSHRWFSKVEKHAENASAMLDTNPLKRSRNSLFPSERLQRHPSDNVSPQDVDAVISSVQRQFEDMSLEIQRPCGNSAVLIVTLNRTLRALVCLRGLNIEWVLVKGFNEDFYTDDDELDMWSKSRYQVFQKVTDHANAAMLHFSFEPPDLAIKSFLTWLHSYLHLFLAPCRQCGMRLQHNMPPTWRDLQTAEVYHETCRP